MSDSVRPHRRQPTRILSLGFSRQEHWSGLPFPSPVQTSTCLKNVRIFFPMSCLEQSLTKVCMFWLIDRYPESLLPLFLVIYLLKNLDSLVSCRSFWILLVEFLWCHLMCSCILIFCILVVKYRDMVRFKLNFFCKIISLWWCVLFFEAHNTWWSLCDDYCTTQKI